MKIRVHHALRNFLNAAPDELKKPSAPLVYAAPFMFEPPDKPVMKPPTTRQLMLLHKELLTDIRDLLNGERLIEIEEKINKLPKPKSFVRFIESGSSRKFPGFEIDREHSSVTLNGVTYCVARVTSMETDLRRLLYGALRAMLESGEFQRLSFCGRVGCDNLTYRATRRPNFCSDSCRWTVNNRSPERKVKRRKGASWYRKK